MNRDRASRQGFLGSRAQSIFECARVGIVGLGGGGSHIVQQLSHIGFRHFVLYDPDIVEASNLNRLIGATEDDVRARRTKVEVAERMIHGLCGHAIVEAYAADWATSPQPLRACDIVFGCLDSFASRRDLEASMRRYLVPLIDIGLDVAIVRDEAPQMGGQVILSMPGKPCMKCMGFLSDANLAKEAARYGDAGIRPQVVWANGVLASAAVGIAVDLLTDWTRQLRQSPYLAFDGNTLQLVPHKRLAFVAAACTHYPVEAVGEPVLVPL